MSLPVDRVVALDTSVLGREAPDVWSTPLRLELTDEPGPGSAKPDATAKSSVDAATPDPAGVDLRFSVVNLTDLAPLRPASDNPADEAPPAATASVREPPPDVASVPVEPEAAATRRPARRAAAQPARPAPRLLGKWVPDAEACQRKNTTYLPLTIGPAGAKAGSASCRFGAMRPAGTGWAVAASCASGRERWTSNVKLLVVGNRLTWSSERGTQTYQRCG